MQSCSTPCLANFSTLSFPTMFVWAPTLRIVTLWWEVFSVFIIRVMRNLFGWLYWDDGFLMWSRRRYMLLRRTVNMSVSIGNVLVCPASITSSYDYPLRGLGNPGRQATMLTCSDPFKNSGTYDVVFSFST